MIRWVRFFAPGCAVICVAALSLYLFSCGSDDDDDDEQGPSWEDRCGDLVDAVYDDCGFTLFDLARADALASCIAEGNDIPWECVADCWEDLLNCAAWYDCVMTECDIQGPDDDTGDDDTGGGADLLGTEWGDCKNKGTADDPWPQELLFEYADGVLAVTHVNAVFNCCIDSIDVTMSVQGFVIDLYEEEIAPEPCDCICPYDVVMTIGGLDPGTYTVNAYSNGTLAVSGEVTIP